MNFDFLNIKINNINSYGSVVYNTVSEFSDEDYIKNKKDIVKSKISHILQKSTGKSIFAIKCEIKEIESHVKNSFLEKHHIQGKDVSIVKLGSFFKNELVAVMTFGKLRNALGNKTSEDGVYELVRFATSENVVGISSKLLSHFIKMYNPKRIITFADRRYSDIKENLYTKIGFTQVKINEPTYWYFKLGHLTLYHRYSFRKQSLNNKLFIFDKDLTEWGNMKLNGYDRIWDCGNIKYEMILNKL
jgi:hypothetical protein